MSLRWAISSARGFNSDTLIEVSVSSIRTGNLLNQCFQFGNTIYFPYIYHTSQASHHLLNFLFRVIVYVYLCPTPADPSEHLYVFCPYC